MENQTRFDLNAAIEHWRDELAAQPNLTPDARRELETHLRDAIAGFRQRGLSDEESFRLARRRIGQPQQLSKEFRKENGYHWNWSRAITACLLVFGVCIWVWSYHTRHSLEYAWANGNVMVVADRGIIQVDFVRRDPQASRVPGDWYNPTTGFEDRGFEWDPHRRHASTGRENLKMWGPRTGFAGLLAEYGFASWNQKWGHLFGPSCLVREVFMPFWFLALLVALPTLFKFVAIRCALFVRSVAIHAEVKSKDSKRLQKTLMFGERATCPCVGKPQFADRSSLLLCR